ncbi:MAG TPA: GNAT family N-acetyltransferase [Hyphomonas sp.]|nr:GNAT family N-acetyltransferase [Hyphomonas sp.]HRX72671.1 GNAT family N-acetyltransferase [Hyphomonas sp.]
MADVERVRSLSRLAYAKWVDLIGREPLPMTADYSVAVKDHLIDLWEENSRLIALIEMIDAPDHLLIENIAVNPDRQGRGCGGILLKHAEHVAYSLGHNELRLFTNAVFVSNIEFYLKRGYEETMREEMGPGRIAVHMSKRLSSRA